ncbi:MAG: hypothetical protein ABII16_02505 [Patescibacteria group bacterium]
MNNTELLQIRVSPKIRLAAEQVAEDSGFSSLQDALRLFLITYSKGQLEPTFYLKPIRGFGEVFGESLDSIINSSLSDVKKGNYVASDSFKKKLERE